MLGPLDLICSEQAAIDGSDGIVSRCCGLCGTTSNKFMNKETEELMFAVVQLRRCASVMHEQKRLSPGQLCVE